MTKRAELSPALGQFLERVEALDQGELLALSVRPSTDDALSLETARAGAAAVAEATGRVEDRERLKGAIVNWASAGGARAGIYAPDLRAGNVGMEDIRMQAAQAIFDAATAELLGADLDASTAGILLARWESAIG